jgi:uncharacterized NAD-dependent epimerase/dehydratase family protein
MLGLTRKTRMERVKDALTDAISYTDELVRDDRLRSDIRSAISHGADARDRLRDDISDGRVTTRLAEDKKLRKHLRALLEDLESASERMRRKRTHRVRNALLIVAGTGAAIVVVPNARRWITSRNGTATAEPIAA